MEIPGKNVSGSCESVEDIAFLANSGNRLAILSSLASGEHSRHVLAEQIAVSRVTIARILDDLEDRRWIRQSGQIAEITSLGAWVAEEFDEMCEMMTVERTLRPLLQWFPVEGYDFHISRLRDAEITLVSSMDATAPIDKLVGQFHETDHIECFSFGITGQFLEAGWRFVVERNHSYEWVFMSKVLDVLTSNEVMRQQSREMLETGRATFYQYDGTIPYIVVLTDGTVNLRLADDAGAPSALIQSRDAEVRTWAESKFEQYRGEGSVVDSAVFT